METTSEEVLADLRSHGRVLRRIAAAAHSALVTKYHWFTHDTPADNLDNDIVERGLTRGCPGRYPEELFDVLGTWASRFVSLHPEKSDLRPQSSGLPPYVRLALNASDLPKWVWVDWSYEWDRCVRPNYRTLHDIDVAAVAQKLGSVAVFQNIPPQVLRIWTQDLPDDPAQWPSLTRETAEAAYQFNY